MPPDPRCPHCDEKVSATATWCMHCSRDFDAPVEAGDGPESYYRQDGTRESLPGPIGQLVAWADAEKDNRQLLAISVGAVAWFLLGGFGGTVTDSRAPFIAGGALAIRGLGHDDPRRILVEGAYATAGLLIALRLLSVAIDPAAQLIGPAVFDLPALLVAIALVVSGRWFQRGSLP